MGAASAFAPLPMTASHSVAERALFNAVWAASVDQARDALAAGADVDAIHPANNRTPLLMAAHLKHTALCRVLLESGANPNATDRGGWNALTIAALAGDGAEPDTNDGAAAAALVAALIALGADPLREAPNGATPLILAASAGHTAVCRVLLKAGAPVNAVNSAGWTALMAAAHRNRSAVCDELLAHGADGAFTDSGGRAPYEVAGNAALKALLQREHDKAVLTRAAPAPAERSAAVARKM